MKKEIRTWHDHYLRIVAGKRNSNEEFLTNIVKLVEKGARSSPIAIQFTDEFAPSHSRLDAASADLWVNDLTRPLFYNDQTSEVAEAALDRAVDLGLPPVLWTLPHSFTKIDAQGHGKIVDAFRGVIKNIEEGSEDWICLAIYVRWISACHFSTICAPAGLIATNILALGANCRELELSYRNKVESLERKKAKRALSKANEGRDELNKHRKARAKEWQNHAREVLGSASTGYSNSAMANHILGKWKRFGEDETRPRKPAKKTIENWLSSEKPSRTRSSTGK